MLEVLTSGCVSSCQNFKWDSVWDCWPLGDMFIMCPCWQMSHALAQCACNCWVGDSVCFAKQHNVVFSSADRRSHTRCASERNICQQGCMTNVSPKGLQFQTDCPTWDSKREQKQTPQLPTSAEMSITCIKQCKSSVRSLSMISVLCSSPFSGFAKLSFDSQQANGLLMMLIKLVSVKCSTSDAMPCQARTVTGQPGHNVSSCTQKNLWVSFFLSSCFDFCTHFCLNHLMEFKFHFQMSIDSHATGLSILHQTFDNLLLKFTPFCSCWSQKSTSLLQSSCIHANQP